MTPAQWHARFAQQAAWTQAVRAALLAPLKLAGQPILEVGCGTGAILATDELAAAAPKHGLDLDLERLHLARSLLPQAALICGDAHRLPYPTDHFAAALCHYLLLWVARPQAVVAEMARVTQPGGAVLALAEPDYGGRVAYPPALQHIGIQQVRALHEQGANPFSGRELRAWFVQAGLRNIYSGVLGGEWQGHPASEEWALEWQVIENDLQGSLPAERLAQLKTEDERAMERGERILYVPTFYIIGWK